MDINTLVQNYLHQDIRNVLTQLLKNVSESNLQEIRLRINLPLEVKIDGSNYLLLENGTTTKNHKYAFVVNKESYIHTLNKISSHSLYAYSDEIKNGFITLDGSHRVGLVGTCVIENNAIKSVKDISSINIRLSHNVIDASKRVMHIYDDKAVNTLIISPPAGGKTTLLRDMIRVFSDKFEQTVGVVDEREELTNSYYVGVRTDVIRNCPKSLAMNILLRTMTPDIITVDELGKKEDVLAVEDCFNCGVTVIATIHGKSIEDILNKQNVKSLLEKKSFDNYIVLGKNPKERPTIYDKNFEEVIYFD